MVCLIVCTFTFGQTNVVTPPNQSAVSSQTSSAPTAPPSHSSNAPPQAQELRLTVGRSLMLQSSERLRRVYVGNPLVIESVTSSPHELIVTAKAAGTSSLATWEEAGTSTLYTIQVDLNVNGLRDALALALPDDDVQVQSCEGRVYLSGTVSSDAAADYAVKMAANYSKEVINSLLVMQQHPKQVQLKVRIAEVDRTKLAQFGISLFSNGKTSGASSTQQFGLPAILNGVIQPSDLLNLFVYNSDLNLGVVLKDLQQRQVLQILAEPNLTSLSGQPARFLSGGEFPFPVVQGTSGAFASVTVQFRPFGVKLEFTPLVNPDGSIRLKVAPEVSALDYTNSVTISGYTIPAISTRRAETEIELRDGQSFAISGLLDHRTTQKLSHMPGIGDIPILGEFFRSRETDLTVTELIVIVTPSVVDPLRSPVAVPPLPAEVIPDLETDRFDRAVKSDSKLPK